MNNASKLLLCLLAVLALGACKATTSTVTVSYEGSGKITESTKIDCGSKCSAEYTNSATNTFLGRGYDITLTATPAAGYELFTWVKGCGASLQCKQRIASVCTVFPGPLQPCPEFRGVNIQAQAVFVPTGSVAQEYRYGTDQNCLVDTSGTLKCWGPEGFGGSDVPAVSSTVEVQLAKNTGCVRDGDNSLQCWGNSSISQVPALGNAGAFALQDRQSCYPNGNDTSCYISGQYACALEGNALKCWGDVPTGITQLMPTLNNPVGLRAHRNDLCVQDSNGEHCWGDNFRGQSRPPALTQPTEISAFGSTTCALSGSGLRCWGGNTGGASTDGTLVNPSSISLASRLCVGDDAGMRCYNHEFNAVMLNTVVEDSARAKWVSPYVCGTDANGIDCWTANTPDEVYHPAALTQVDDFDVNGKGACGIQGRTLACWADSEYSDFWPAKDSANRTVPLMSPRAVAINRSTICVGGNDGLYCRHDNTGSTLATTQPQGLKGITALQMNTDTACALHNAGVTCWGSNQYGVADVPALKNPRRIALGDYHACALDDTGVVCWGETLPKP